MCQMMKQIMMSPLFLACLLLALSSGAQAKEKQIQLEDIERDNLAAERRAKQHHHHHHPLNNQYLPKSHSHPTITGTPIPPKMQYGFVPIKTPQNYAPTPAYQHYQQQQEQQQQEYRYVTPSHTHTQAYLPLPQQHQQPPPRHHAQQAQQAYKAPAQVTPQVTEAHPDHQETYAVTQATHGQHQQSSGNGQRLHTQYIANAPVQTQAYQQYLQHQPQTQIQYIPESQLQQYQYQHPQQPQIQYIVDNSIQNQPTDIPKYYQQQQYVYLQPYQSSSASNNIHSVADTKGNVQYVMYVPTAAAYPTETVLAYPTNQETQYVYQPVDEAAKLQAPESKYAQVEYVEDVQKPPAFPDARVARPVFKHQPTSLLDSYVPSYLQFQYYKQQQENANVIKQSIKLSSAANVGKSDVVKGSYKNDAGISTAEQQRSNY